MVAYKDGKKWAENSVKTTEVATGVMVSADRRKIRANGIDLTFIGVWPFNE